MFVFLINVSCTIFIKLIPKHFISFDGIINGITYLISGLNDSLHIQKCHRFLGSELVPSALAKYVYY